jgi:hypothetical protein
MSQHTKRPSQKTLHVVVRGASTVLNIYMDVAKVGVLPVLSRPKVTCTHSASFTAVPMLAKRRPKPLVSTNALLYLVLCRVDGSAVPLTCVPHPESPRGQQGAIVFV